MFSLQVGPAAFFILDGVRSGLMLPRLGRELHAGFSFHTWLRVETFLPPRDGLSAAGAPRLFSLHDEQQRGIEAFFERPRRAVHLSSRRAVRVISASCSHDLGKLLT